MKKLKIGTRVEHVEFGKGTVKYDDKTIYTNYIVEFDNQNIRLHQGNSNVFVGREKSCWYCDISSLKVIKEDTISVPELKERYIVTYRNGEEAMYLGDNFIRPLRTIREGEFASTDETANMFGVINTTTLKHLSDEQYDIVAVHRHEYKTIWTRKETKKTKIKLNQKDIEEILGYEIEIVEGEK